MVENKAHQEVIKFKEPFDKISEINIFGARVKATQDKFGKVYIVVLQKINFGKVEETNCGRIEKRFGIIQGNRRLLDITSNAN